MPSAGFHMPTTPYLADLDVDPKTKRVLNDALEKTRLSLGLEDEFADGIIAKQTSNLSKPASAIPISCVKAH
jgi:hypothetical protein